MFGYPLGGAQRTSPVSSYAAVPVKVPTYSRNLPKEFASKMYKRSHPISGIYTSLNVTVITTRTTRYKMYKIHQEENGNPFFGLKLSSCIPVRPLHAHCTLTK